MKNSVWVWECGDVGDVSHTPTLPYVFSVLSKVLTMRRCHWILTSLLFLAACAPAAEVPIPPTAYPWSSAPELLGTEWVLVELNGAAPLPGSHVTLAFEAEQLSGYAGCNWYGSPYHDGGETPAVGFSLTKRACLEPEGVMAQEQAYLTALQSAVGRRVTSDRLEYYDASGATLAAFAPL